MRFILVDQILDLTPGQSIRALTHIHHEEDYFNDHFPGFPVVPGVLLTEMMAQAAGKCLDAEAIDRGKAMLARINAASFRDWVRPGQDCILFAQIRKSRSQYATAETRIEVNDRPVCSADLMFSFTPMDTFAPGYRDTVLEDYLARQGREEK